MEAFRKSFIKAGNGKTCAKRASGGLNGSSFHEYAALLAFCCKSITNLQNRGKTKPKLLTYFQLTSLKKYYLQQYIDTSTKLYLWNHFFNSIKKSAHFFAWQNTFRCRLSSGQQATLLWRKSWLLLPLFIKEPYYVSPCTSSHFLLQLTFSREKTFTT